MYLFYSSPFFSLIFITFLSFLLLFFPSFIFIRKWNFTNLSKKLDKNCQDMLQSCYAFFMKGYHNETLELDMKFTILLEILFDLFTKEKITATELAQKYQLSARTVYRYVDLLATVLPLQIKRGRNGGISLADNFQLPMGFMTLEEYNAAIDALIFAYSHQPDERFLAAKRKLSAQKKKEMRALYFSQDSQDILFDGWGFGDVNGTTEKLRLAQACIQKKNVAEIEFLSPKGEKTKRKIEPHLLVAQQNGCYLYAFCYTLRAFHLFPMSHIIAFYKTDETFQSRSFQREELPIPQRLSPTVRVQLEISKDALSDAQHWLGAENVRCIRQKTWFADVSLPDDERLARTILSFGAGVKVLSPASLSHQIAQEAKNVAKRYS